MSKRLVKIAKELNMGTGAIVGFLSDKGFKIDNRPTAKISDEMYEMLILEFEGVEHRTSRKNLMEESKKKEAKQKNPGTTPTKTVNDKSKISANQKNKSIKREMRTKRSSDKKVAPVEKERQVGSVIFKTRGNAKEKTVFDYLNEFQVSTAKEKIVGTSIQEIAGIFKINPNRIIVTVDSSTNKFNENDRITDAVWRENIEFFLIHFYNKFLHRKISGLRRKKEKRRFENNTKNKKKSIKLQVSKRKKKKDRKKHSKVLIRRKIRREEDERETKKRKMEVKTKNRSKKIIGNNRYGDYARIIYIGHNKY